MERALAAAAGADLGGLLVTAAADVRYLSGFTGSSGWLVVKPDRQLLLTDSRYAEQAPREAPDFEVRVVETSLHRGVAELDLGRCIGLGADPDALTHAAWRRLTAHDSIRLVAVQALVSGLRRAKDADEIAAIRRALALAEDVLAEVASEVRVGWSENEVAAQLEHRCRIRGAEAMAFETIVAAGPRGAMPHARPGPALIAAGDVVVIDFGCVVDGYCSDITRSLWVDAGTTGPDDWVAVHAAVDAARAAAMAAIAPGVRAAEVDRVARDILDQRGLGRYFSHSLGHGVGLQVHESPRLSSRSEAVLAVGDVVTVEPGVYLPGRGGLRLEDMAHVTSDGADRLNRLDTAPLHAGPAA